MFHISLWAVLLATVISFAFGALWYSPLLFLREWGHESGLDADKMAVAAEGDGGQSAAGKVSDFRCVVTRFEGAVEGVDPVTDHQYGVVGVAGGGNHPQERLDFGTHPGFFPQFP